MKSTSTNCCSNWSQRKPALTIGTGEVRARAQESAKLRDEPDPLRNSLGQQGFTLVELMATITIIAILASVIFVVSMSVRKKAEQVQCGRNLSTLFLALKAELDNTGRWPQVEMGSDGDEEKYWERWFEVLEKHDLPEEVWVCPTHLRGLQEDFPLYSSYHPMPFDGTSSNAPYRYSNMPWLIEIGDNHGNGPLIIMPDGSIQAGMSIEAPQTSLGKRPK